MTFYPSAPSELAASRVEIRNGNNLENVDIILGRPRSRATVSLTVLAADGRPAENALLSIEHRDKGPLITAPIGKKGETSIELFEGDEYLLSVSRPVGKADESVPPILQHFRYESGKIRIIASPGLKLILKLQAEKQ